MSLFKIFSISSQTPDNTKIFSDCDSVREVGNTLLRNNKRNIGHGAILIWGGQCSQTYNGVSLDNFDIRIENNRAVAPYSAEIIQVRPAGCNHNVTMTGNFTSTNPADAGTLRQELLNKGAGRRW